MMVMPANNAKGIVHYLAGRYYHLGRRSGDEHRQPAAPGLGTGRVDHVSPGRGGSSGRVERWPKKSEVAGSNPARSDPASSNSSNGGSHE